MAKKIGVAYIYMGTVKDWFVSRASGNRDLTLERKRKKIFKNNLTILKEMLKSDGWINPTLSYSQYAGCSCGCSPGYVIRAEGNRMMSRDSFTFFTTREDRYDYGEVNVWLKPDGSIDQFRYDGKLKMLMNR